jgi:phosphoglycolate phosphatase-like HAD superfamily hydrolase
VKRAKNPIFLIIVLAALVLAAALAHAGDPLSSWNEGPAKKAITDFVSRVTNEGSPDYVQPGERIAAFDNDGTLWAEQPMYFQFFFAIDRLKAMAPQHPEWKDKEPYSSLLKGDVKHALEVGGDAVNEIFMVTDAAGMTTEEFEKIVKDWTATARHPKTGRLYTEMVYQPMIELMEYLRANGFKTFMVSGGAIDFMRPWTQQAYGIPPEQVIGSSVRTKFEIRDGKPVIARLSEVDFIDDRGGKPVGINSHIGRRPVAAFGNSDGDREMLEWTQAGGGARLMLLVHHDDAAREWSYGAESKIGTFSDALMNEADKSGWIVVSMKNDWKVVFPFERK